MTNLKKLLSILTACLVLMSCTFLIGCGDKEKSDSDDKSTSDKKDKDDSSSSEKDDKSESDKVTTTAKEEDESKTTTTEKKKPSGNGNAGVDYEIAGSVPSGFDEDSLIPVNAFMNGMQQQDYGLFLDMFPSVFIEMMKLMGGDSAITNEELMQQLMEEELPADVEAEFHYVVKDFSEFTADELSEMNEMTGETGASLSVLGIQGDFTVTDGYHITIDLDAEMSYSGENVSASHEVEFEVIKMGGDWCFNVLDDSGNDFMTKFAEAFEEDFDGMFLALE
jgi:hypothetical protein